MKRTIRALQSAFYAFRPGNDTSIWIRRVKSPQRSAGLSDGVSGDCQGIAAIRDAESGYGSSRSWADQFALVSVRDARERQAYASAPPSSGIAAIDSESFPTCTMSWRP